MYTEEEVQRIVDRERECVERIWIERLHNAHLIIKSQAQQIDALIETIVRAEMMQIRPIIISKEDLK